MGLYASFQYLYVLMSKIMSVMVCNNEVKIFLDVKSVHTDVRARVLYFQVIIRLF